MKRTHVDRNLWPFVERPGAGCAVLVVLVHVCEALHWFPAMGWLKNSAGPYIDLVAAILGFTLFPLGYFLHSLFSRFETDVRRFLFAVDFQNSKSTENCNCLGIPALFGAPSEGRGELNAP